MKLMIPAAIERKLNAYVQGLDAEIAGMGACEVRDDGNIWVTDIAIYEQEVTGGTADLSSAALAKFQTDLIRSGQSPKNWYLWWHSHNNMQSFFSKTDTDTIELSTEFDYLVSLVVNKRRERKCRVDYHRPFRMYLDNVAIEVAPDVTPETADIDAELAVLRQRMEELYKEKNTIVNRPPEGIAEEIAAKVRTKTYASQPVGFGSQGHKSNLPALPLKQSINGKKDDAVHVSEVLGDGDNELADVELLIAETERLIKEHRANGNGNTQECIQLINDLEDYQAYRNELLWKWVDEKKQNAAEKYGNAYHNDDDDLGLPPLPGGYKYGFNSKEY